MSFTRTSHRGALLLAAWIVFAPAAGAHDDTLAQAKELYATAAYEEALVLLDRLQNGASSKDSTDVAEYRVFCLFALDRRDEAQKAIEGILTVNPLYALSSDLASPRIQSIFRDTRRQVLPSIVTGRYAEAKAAFERKDPQAGQRFDDVLALLDDPDVRSVTALRDLRTVVSAFRDLTRAMAAAAPPPGQAQPQPPTPSPDRAPDPIPREPMRATAPPARVNPNTIYTSADQDVVPAVVLANRMPPWSPAPRDAMQEFKGTLELLVDERGLVTSATLRSSVHPVYDAQLLKAVRAWKFAPAKKQGTPVPYLKIIDIRLTPRLTTVR